MAETSSLLKAGLCVTAIGVLFALIGIPTPYWANVYTVGSSTDFQHVGLRVVTTKVGLFQICFDPRNVGGSVCEAIPRALLFDWVHASRDLNIIGLLLGVGCRVAGIVHAFLMNSSIIQIAQLSLAFVSGLFILIGASVFAGVIGKAAANPIAVAILNGSGTGESVMTWSFTLTLISSLLFLASGIISVINRRQAQTQNVLTN